MSSDDASKKPALSGIRWKIIKHRITFGVLFAFVLGVAVMTPHIIHGHFIVPEKFGQSVVILLDILVFLVIFFFYQRETRKLMEEKKAGERLLSDSYRYIGKANRTMEILSQFMDVPVLPVSRKDEKGIFVRLSSVLLVTILKTGGGTLRFVNRSTERTAAEYNFSLNGVPFKAKIPNKELIGERYYERIGDGVTVVTSGSRDNEISCSLCFVAIDDIETDRKRLAATLLNQLLILFIIYRSSREKSGLDAEFIADGKQEVVGDGDGRMDDQREIFSG